MKKYILAVFLLIPAMAFASPRVDELKKEADGLIQQRSAVLQEVQKIEVRLIEIQGALKEYDLKIGQGGLVTTPTAESEA